MALNIPQVESKTSRNEGISWVHIHPFTGHVGWQRTSEILRRDFWWLGMDQDIMKYVESCEVCSRNQSANMKKAGVQKKHQARKGQRLAKGKNRIFCLLERTGLYQ